MNDHDLVLKQPSWLGDPPWHKKPAIWSWICLSQGLLVEKLWKRHGQMIHHQTYTEIEFLIGSYEMLLHLMLNIDDTRHAHRNLRMYVLEDAQWSSYVPGISQWYPHWPLTEVYTHFEGLIPLYPMIAPSYPRKMILCNDQTLFMINILIK
jgi:hypothetical protein